MRGLLIFAVLLLVFAGSAFAVVNINTATHAELEALQGIGPAKAKAIVEHREKNGMFASTESLIDVDGIGKGTMKQLENSITVGNTVDTETTAAMTKQ